MKTDTLNNLEALNKIRAEFESWARSVGYEVDMFVAEGDTTYSDTFANVAWEAWQGALIAQARAASPAEDKALPPEATEKKAKLSLSLRADSGYMSDETHRISVEQWGRICTIVNEKG